MAIKFVLPILVIKFTSTINALPLILPEHLISN